MTQTTLTPLSPEVLRERIESGAAVVIDVRTPAEFAVEHIAGSYNVPLDTLKEHTGDVAGVLLERVQGDVVRAGDVLHGELGGGAHVDHDGGAGLDALAQHLGAERGQGRLGHGGLLG